MPGPAYRILTPRLVIRCWEPADAPRLARATEESREHLRPEMPWAEQVETLDQQVDKLRRFRAALDRGEDFIYGIFDRDGEILGGTGLHTRQGPNAREIGYWVHAAHVGRGIATEASAALVRVAFEIDRVDRVEIHCSPANPRSARVAEKLGFRHEATLRRRLMVPGREPRDTMIWSLFAEEWRARAEPKIAIEAFDAAGRPIELDGAR